MSPNRILATAFLFASAFASADVHIDENIPYRDEEEIEETGAKSDVTVVRDGKKQGTYADIAITSAMSAGNAFIGHAKGMAVSATLYETFAIT